MLVPTAWEQNNLLDKNIRAFHKYHTCLIEPWDGPAAIAFTDGQSIGAVLDRNGLRPCRYIVTKSGFVVMASEVGVLDIIPSDILYSGRLEPGKTFFIDTARGCIVEDSQIKKELALNKPYEQWVRNNILELDSLADIAPRKYIADTLKQLKSFGYTREDLKMIIKPMA